MKIFDYKSNTSNKINRNHERESQEKLLNEIKRFTNKPNKEEFGHIEDYVKLILSRSYLN